MPRRVVLTPEEMRPERQDTQLPVQEERFVQEYMIDFNATQAAKRAGYSAHTAGGAGYLLLRRPRVRERIDQLMVEKRDRNHISADEAMMYHFDRSRVTVPILVRTGCCRHCHGQDHRYQFTLDEYRAARQKHIERQRTLAERNRREFDDLGGVGFDPYKPVFSRANGQDHDCPECWGRGAEYPMTVKEIEETLSPEQRQLINGYVVSTNRKDKSVKYEFQDRFKHAALAYDLAALIRPVKPIDRFLPSEMSDAQLEEVVRAAENQGLLPDLRDTAGIPEPPATIDATAEEVDEQAE